MLKIDAHQHFWKFDAVRDSWITPEMAEIRQDFMPAQLLPVLQRNEVDGSIAVQSNQTEDDNKFLLDLAKDNNFIKGIVGWVDLRADNVEEKLQYYKNYPLIKGFRHVLQAEPNEQFMLTKKFKRGIGLLNQYGYTYDLLIYPKHIKYTLQLVAEFPDQKFVIDHLAKPDIKNKDITAWKTDMEAIAIYPNLSCKVSGIITEANWYAWLTADFTPYLDVVFDAFGIKKLMFGSDWPVCNLAGGYNRAIEILQLYTSRLSTHEQDKFWSGNAVNFYDIDIEI